MCEHDVVTPLDETCLTPCSLTAKMKCWLAYAALLAQPTANRKYPSGSSLTSSTFDLYSSLSLQQSQDVQFVSQVLA